MSHKPPPSQRDKRSHYNPTPGPPVQDGHPGCGECQACCVLVSVPQLDPPKPLFTPCVHQCATGCGIYPTRPLPCRDFRCAWHLEMGPPENRPDRLGIMFTQAHGPPGQPMVGAWEVRPGAFHEPAAVAMFDNLARGGIGVVRVKPGSVLALGPDGTPMPARILDRPGSGGAPAPSNPNSTEG
jgi:hypothetical protein